MATVTISRAQARFLRDSFYSKKGRHDGIGIRSDGSLTGNVPCCSNDWPEGCSTMIRWEARGDLVLHTDPDATLDAPQGLVYDVRECGLTHHGFRATGRRIGSDEEITVSIPIRRSIQTVLEAFRWPTPYGAWCWFITSSS